MRERDIKAAFQMLYDRLEGLLKDGRSPEVLDVACEAAAFVVGGRDIGLEMSKEEFDLVELLARYHGQS